MPAGSDTPSAPPPQPTRLTNRAGYVPPTEAAKRESQDRQADDHFNMSAVKMYEQRKAADDAVNAVAAGGGFKMDLDAMRTFLPQWQAIADKLQKLQGMGRNLINLREPAEDEASTMQIKAARAHADVYLKSVQAQQEYAQRYADNLRKAIEAHEKGNQAATDAVNKSGRGH